MKKEKNVKPKTKKLSEQIKAKLEVEIGRTEEGAVDLGELQELDYTMDETIDPYNLYN